ncbi:hypothetical protein TNCV_4374591 [Trichonephila clavipes]|uniref:Uncharacterized protein n=1 Tax=Trichonephila clavipes TaxID=2585209 RepID=A0A8X6R4I6_TRICX|nr:hypothetical protein TNCV_4374591 [Trichonephila clavipes]
MQNSERNQKPCSEGPVPSHLAAEREPPKDKPCSSFYPFITERQAIRERKSPYLTRSQAETRSQEEGETSRSQRNRYRLYKLRRGKDVTTTGFASEEERQFTLEQSQPKDCQR